MVARIKLKKGLDISIPGAPSREIDSGRPVTTVALVGADFAAVHPRIQAEPGQQVRLGDPLVLDKHNPVIRFTSPGTGTVREINRGYRRRLQSLVIELDDSSADDKRFSSPEKLDPTSIRNLLLQSGTWTGFRTRPFDRIPDPGTSPGAIFVTAIDTRPLAADPVPVVARYEEDFARGLNLICNLAEVPKYLCTGPNWSERQIDQKAVNHVVFDGAHPAGLPGTHIHRLYPVSADRQAWHINYQHVIAIGHLARTGTIMTERVVALAGPGVKNPRLLITRAGANLQELLADELQPDEKHEVISGSVLDGYAAQSPFNFLGHYHNQISVIPDHAESKLFGWFRLGCMDGKDRKPKVHGDASLPYTRNSLAAFSAGTNARRGRKSALMPTESFERVMPLDILPTPLLRALLVADTDSAQALGCLELAEEDLALCSYVCPAKQDYGAALRMNLSQIAEQMS